MTPLNTIIEEEKKEFDGAFMNNGINGVLDDQFQDPKMLLMRTHFTTAMQRAYEAGHADWLRSEIEKLEGEIEKPPVGGLAYNRIHRIGMNTAITSIITRYKEELKVLESK